MKIEIPTICPSCGNSLERVKDQLFCKNSSCGEIQIKKVSNYAKVMKIKGLGERTIEKLELKNINDIYSLSLSAATAAIGEKLAVKLLDEIEKSKNASLDKFIAACSIPLIGMTAGTKLATLISNPMDLTVEICKKAGLGDKATANIMDWYENEYEENLFELPISFEEKIISNIENKYTVCITGRITGYTKAQLANYLNPYSVTVVDNLSKKVDYLLCDERKNSTKEQKANELNIKILTLNEFKKEININV